MRFEDLSREVIERAKEHLIYHVGLAFNGISTEAGTQALKICQALGGDGSSSTLIGQASKAAPLEASFANSTFMRAWGLDDVLFPSATHAGLLTVPVALALGEQQHRSGKDLLAAIVTGYEVLGKMVVEESAERVPRRPSMPFGAFAGATVAARLMQLTPKQTANAIGYAADSAMGLKEGNEQQPTHVYGWIARNAITAAVVARAGGETAPTILEGPYGFYATLIGRMPNPAVIVARLGEDPEILRATQKRFPGTAMNIVPVELVQEMVTEHRLTASNVSQVEIELPEDRRTFTDSISTGPFPSRTQAESSAPFQTAIILLDGKINFARYEQLDDPAILAVLKKISVKLAPHDNTRFARVRIKTRDGRTLDRQKENHVFPPLDRMAWLSRDGEKFLPRSSLERFIELADTLERVGDVTDLMAPLTAGS